MNLTSPKYFEVFPLEIIFRDGFPAIPERLSGFSLKNTRASCSARCLLSVSFFGPVSSSQVASFPFPLGAVEATPGVAWCSCTDASLDSAKGAQDRLRDGDKIKPLMRHSSHWLNALAAAYMLLLPESLQWTQLAEQWRWVLLKVLDSSFKRVNYNRDVLIAVISGGRRSSTYTHCNCLFMPFCNVLVFFLY